MAVVDTSRQSSHEHVPLAITRRDRAKFLASELKSNVRDLLTDDDNSEGNPDTIYGDTAFDPQRALHHDEDGPASIRDRVNIGVQNVKSIVKNPKAVSRNKYTRQAATKVAVTNHETRYDTELIDAHDTVEDELSKTGFDSTDGERLESAQQRVRQVERHREDLKSAWILGRHIVRAKVIREPISKPAWTENTTNDPPDQLCWVTGSRYLSQLILWWTHPFTAQHIDDFDEPPFDLAELGLAFERLVAVSTPWQSFCSKVRDIYRWKHPRITARVMVFYWILWYFQRLGAFVLAWLVYSTIKSKIHTESIDEVRERVQRSRDQEASVRSWAELVQKHGPDEWIEPLADGIGPHLQMQATDLAMFLERLQNFYRWENPRQTCVVLCLLSAGSFFLFFASTQACSMIFTFILGVYFFYSFPIATNYPKYRHVVRPLSWVVWSVPDDAELAINRLQNKAIQQEGVDELHFTGVLLPTHSRTQITLTRRHITIEHEDHSTKLYPYSQLLEIIKVDINKDADTDPTHTNARTPSRSSHRARWLEKTAGVQLSPDALSFVFIERTNTQSHEATAAHVDAISPTMSPTEGSGEKVIKFTLLVNKSDRDRIFTTVLAWSNLRWQPLFSQNRQRKLCRDEADGACKSKRHYGVSLNPELDDAVKRGFT